MRPIVYGEPSPELEAEAARGEVALGGCCIVGGGFDNRWACVACGAEWGRLRPLRELAGPTLAPPPRRPARGR